ncbi:MAG: hypothetical protein ACK551_02170 [Vampirovibrionales bacterium]
MRITSFAPSMTKPTYAVSSTPQGTFGASTPMVRSVAPASTETQRSGGLPTNRFLAGATALLTSVSLAGCGEKAAANLADSLVPKVNAGEEALVVEQAQKALVGTGLSRFYSVFRAVNFPGSTCPLRYSEESTLAGFDHFVIGPNTDRNGETSLTLPERFDCAREMAVLKDRDPSQSSAEQFSSTFLPEILNSPNPKVNSMGGELMISNAGAVPSSPSGSYGGSCEQLVQRWEDYRVEKEAASRAANNGELTVENNALNKQGQSWFQLFGNRFAILGDIIAPEVCERIGPPLREIGPPSRENIPNVLGLGDDNFTHFQKRLNESTVPNEESMGQ